MIAPPGVGCRNWTLGQPGAGPGTSGATSSRPTLSDSPNLAELGQVPRRTAYSPCLLFALAGLINIIQ